MPVSRPREPVYYYECSGGGDFRLFYFMPPETLERIIHESGASPQVLEDHPDGVDIRCTATDYEDFRDLYEYEIPIDAESISATFYALFSDTRDYEEFRGSGFIAARDLEPHLDEVREALNQEEIDIFAPTTGVRERGVKRSPPDGVSGFDSEPSLSSLPLEERRQVQQERSARESSVASKLEEMPMRGVDSKLSLRRQSFSTIEMAAGEEADGVFTKLHQGRETKR